MKQNIKRLWLVLCVAACFLTLSACGQKKAEVSTLDPQVAEILPQVADAQLRAFDALTDTTIETYSIQFEKEKNSAMVNALASWKSVTGDLGRLVSVDSSTVEETDEGYLVTTSATFEKRTMEFGLLMSQENEILNISFSPTYTTGENMEKAFMNMIMGMGTVFIVLIFISLIIGCFKYINVWEKNMRKKEEALKAPAPVAASSPAPAVTAPAVAPVVQAPEIFASPEMVDDLELVAVITAAISAAASVPAEGLVVRSIKRRPSSWKHA